MNFNRLLHRLETELAVVAREAMEHPAGGDVFSHGRSVGVYAGLQRVKQIIDEMLNEDRSREL